MFYLLFCGILFLSTVVKWYMLKERIEANGWSGMNPCEFITFLVYLIPVVGQMTFLAAMTTMDEGAAVSREEASDVICVQVGPMGYVFRDGSSAQESREA